MDLSYELLEQQCTTSLYDPSCTLWKKIQNSRQHNIIVCFTENSSDYHSQWNDGISLKIYHEQLSQSIAERRTFLAELGSRGISLISIFTGSSLDSYFDFSLACNYRFLANQNSFIGFTQAGANCFPAFSRAHQSQTTTFFNSHVWHKKPTLTGHTALLNHIMDSCPFTSDGKIDFTEALKIAKSKKTSSKKSSFQAPFKPGMGPDQNKKSKLWFYKKRVLSHKNFSNSLDIERIASDIAAKQYLSKEYATLIAEGVLHNPYASLAKNVELPKKIYIDLRSQLPDLQVVFNLLSKHSMRIIFIHDDKNLLSEFLNIIYARLENMSTSQDHLDHWRLRVHWLVGNPDDLKDVFKIRFLANKWVLATHKNNSLKFFIVNSDLGFIEVQKSAEPLDKDFQQVLHYLYGKPLAMPALATQLPNTYLIRAIFFEKMLDYCKEHKVELDQIADVFKKTKWSFAGNPYQWKVFLNSRFMFYSDFLDMSDFDLNPDFWSIQSWYKAQYMIKSKLSFFKDSVHFYKVISDFKQIYFEIYEQLLEQGKSSVSSKDLNLLIKASLGIPSTQESPIRVLTDDHPRYLNISSTRRANLRENILQ